MRLLIDGYNVMHAAGLMARRFGPDGLRRTRHRFLNNLADALGPERAAETTVVFDASSLPRAQAAESSHKGLTVILAIEDEDADSRIERLIAAHSAPKSLTVVSSDRRIRRAARGRRSTSLSADDFLDDLDALRRHRRSGTIEGLRLEEHLRADGPGPAEADRWVAEFADLDADPILEAVPDPLLSPPEWSDAELERVAEEVAAESAADDALAFPPDDWTDDEMARIARQVDDEFRRHGI